MTNILVTGGAGYIGSHTCKQLSLSGYSPVVFDNLSTGHKGFIQWGEFVRGDIQEVDDIRRVFEQFDIAAVIHFAASAYVGESVEKPLEYYNNNLRGSINLLKVMQENDCSRLIFSSSCATYGLPEAVPISVNHPQNPVNPYGSSKLFVERVIRDYVNANPFNATILRYFNAAGADASTDLEQGKNAIGERHEPETHLIPNVINAAISGEAVSVFGVDYDTPDGTCIRDYIHVTDLAGAHVSALKEALAWDQTNKEGKLSAYNLGSEKGFSVFEIIAAVEEVTGKSVAVDEQARRSGDVPILVADSAGAKQELGWQPQHSSLDTIVKSAYLWALSEHSR